MIGIQQICEENSLRRKNITTVRLKTGRFDNKDAAAIISSVSSLFQFCSALLTLLMMTAESMWSKRPVLSFTVALFFLLKHIEQWVLTFFPPVPLFRGFLSLPPTCPIFHQKNSEEQKKGSAHPQVSYFSLRNQLKQKKKVITSRPQKSLLFFSSFAALG